nr:hypothetical protein Iba_chr06bCG6850 [Ipomoea batatas]
MLYIKPNKPRSKRNVFICISMKAIPVNRYIGSQILGDCIYLSSCMPKVLITLLPKFPVFWFMILHTSLCENRPRLHAADINTRFRPMTG